MKTKINNSFLTEKILLRKDLLNKLKIKKVNVLDCYGGEGIIWGRLSNFFDVKRTGIDTKRYNGVNNIIGENLKIIPSLDLTKFNVIDLDAYGYPIKQLNLILKSKFKGVVFITIISAMGAFSAFPKDVYKGIGYNYDDVKKIKTLFSKNFEGKIKGYLYSIGIRNITYYLLGKTKNKFYGGFIIKE